MCQASTHNKEHPYHYILHFIDDKLKAKRSGNFSIVPELVHSRAVTGNGAMERKKLTKVT